MGGGSRCASTPRLHPGPSLGQPKLGPAIAAVGDERAVLAAGRHSRCDREGCKIHLVARRLVVERERRAAMSDLGDAAFEALPAERGGSSPSPSPSPPSDRLTRTVRRQERIFRQEMLHVGEDQLLMLLFVVPPELERRRDCRRGVRERFEVGEPLIDRRAVGDDLFRGGPRHEPALGAFDALADALVVRVEEEIVGVAHGRNAERSEHEPLEEPGRVREVPLHGARIGHRLRDPVLDLERIDELHRRPPRREDPCYESRGILASMHLRAINGPRRWDKPRVLPAIVDPTKEPGSPTIDGSDGV